MPGSRWQQKNHSEQSGPETPGSRWRYTRHSEESGAETPGSRWQYTRHSEQSGAETLGSRWQYTRHSEQSGAERRGSRWQYPRHSELSGAETPGSRWQYTRHSEESDAETPGSRWQYTRHSEMGPYGREWVSVSWGGVSQIGEMAACLLNQVMALRYAQNAVTFSSPWRLSRRGIGVGAMAGDEDPLLGRQKQQKQHKRLVLLSALLHILKPSREFQLTLP
jgi:hypothetical protein